MSTLRHSQSSDILFPEDSQSPPHYNQSQPVYNQCPPATNQPQPGQSQFYQSPAGSQAGCQHPKVDYNQSSASEYDQSSPEYNHSSSSSDYEEVDQMMPAYNDRQQYSSDSPESMPSHNESFYSTQSHDTYSSYSREIKYIFEPEYYYKEQYLQYSGNSVQGSYQKQYSRSSSVSSANSQYSFQTQNRGLPLQYSQPKRLTENKQYYRNRYSTPQRHSSIDSRNSIDETCSINGQSSYMKCGPQRGHFISSTLDRSYTNKRKAVYQKDLLNRSLDSFQLYDGPNNNGNSNCNANVYSLVNRQVSTQSMSPKPVPGQCPPRITQQPLPLPPKPQRIVEDMYAPITKDNQNQHSNAQKHNGYDNMHHQAKGNVHTNGHSKMRGDPPPYSQVRKNRHSYHAGMNNSFDLSRIEDKHFKIASNEESPLICKSQPHTNEKAVATSSDIHTPVRRREIPPSSADSRRHTWSPPTFSKVIANGELRSFHSNDHMESAVEEEEEEGAEELYGPEEHIYEDLDSVAATSPPPPKLAPESGKLHKSQTAHKSLVRPIACKPVVTPQQQQRYAGASPQQPSHPGPLPRPTPHNASPHSNSSTSRIAMVTPGSPPLGSPPPRPPPYESAAATKLASVNQSQDDGYVSQEYHSHTNSLASNHGAAPPPPPQNGGGRTALHSQYGNNAPQPQPMTNGYHGNHNNQQTVPNHHGNNSNAMQNLHHHGNRANQQGYGVHSSNGSGPLSPRPAHQYSQQPETMNSPKVTYLTDSGQKVITPDSGSLGSAKRPDSYSSANSIVAATTRQLESYTPASSSRSHPDSRPSSYTHRDSNGSLQQSAPRDDSFNSSSNRAGAGADSSLNSSSGRGMMNDSSFVTQTPSPSDSGVGELEVILREKDAQIRQLRETMERNETAILQVCEEKQQNWEVRWRELSAEWEQRLRHQTQKAFKMEQALLMQLFKLQQERKDLRSEVEELRGRQQTHDALMLETGDEIKALKTKLEELQWDMCQKVGEISHLKTQLKEAKEDNAVKANELVAIKSQLKESQQESGEKNGEILGLESELKLSQDELKQAKLEIESLKKQLQNNNSPKPEPKANGLSKDNAVVDKCDVESELAKCREQFEKEREKWLAEKDKVIRYQRHLQLNYVQMANKNKLLEAEVQQLTLELERSDVCLQDVEEGEESVC